jgi:hypothetical protein
MTDTAPLTRTLHTQIDAATLTTDTQSVLGEAPFAATVTKATYVPAAAITGANTNNRALTVTNRGQDGSGTTVVATITFASGTNAVKDDALAITLSGTPANLVVASGDVLTVDSVHAGTGIAEPGGDVAVDLTRS